MAHSDATKTFRTMSREAKFKSVLAMCRDLKEIPKTYDTKTHIPSDAEKVRGQFYINMQSARTRGELPEEFHQYLDQIAEYGNPRLSLQAKVDVVFDFYVEKIRLPAKSKDDSNSIVGHWKAIRCINVDNPPEPLSKRRVSRLKKMQQYAATIAPPTRLDRLKNLLEYCKTHKRTPKQHSSNREEKRLADFYSTVKQTNKTTPLGGDELKLFNEIGTYMPVNGACITNFPKNKKKIKPVGIRTNK